MFQEPTLAHRGRRGRLQQQSRNDLPFATPDLARRAVQTISDDLTSGMRRNALEMLPNLKNRLLARV